jgi:hypothetical protein
VPESAGDRPQPAAFRAVAQQHLGDRQAEQLGVAELGRSAWAAAGLQQLINGDVQCDDEVVETGVHEASQEVDVAKATPTLGGLVSTVTLSSHHPIWHQ